MGNSPSGQKSPIEESEPIKPMSLRLRKETVYINVTENLIATSKQIDMEYYEFDVKSLDLKFNVVFMPVKNVKVVSRCINKNCLAIMIDKRAKGALIDEVYIDDINKIVDLLDTIRQLKILLAAPPPKDTSQQWENNKTKWENNKTKWKKGV